MGMAVWTVGWGVFLSIFLEQPAVALLLQLLAAAGVLMLSVVGNRRSFSVDQKGRYIYSYDRGRTISLIGMIINSLCVLVVLFLAVGYGGYPRGFCGFPPEGLLKGPICELLWEADSIWGAIVFGFGTVAS